MSTHVVIVGNGIAGMQAALGVRAREPSWPITIVSEESDHFFSRTALMWVHSGQLDHRGIEPYERDLYARQGFTRVRARAVGVDTERELLRLAGDQDALSYDRLIIACGSAPRRGPWPGSDLRGVGHFVTLQDLEWFEKEVYGPTVRERPPRADAHLGSTTEDSPYLHRASAAEKRERPLERAVVIGGGLVGIEAVEVLRAAKKQVTFLIREDWYWPMAIDSRESTWIAERMREHGVDVRLGENVEAMLADDDGNVRAVKTDAGEVPADAVVVAVGVIPNTEWLTGSDIEVDQRGGVVVDDSLKASAANVIAAGDCASVRWHDGVVIIAIGIGRVEDDRMARDDLQIGGLGGGGG
ncbi:MAG: FAD-dependent oxidoreductase, partial [Deltaproteobacteria bacterium]|nr:FAD-dependent oxidoreductase [Deltaproteobacteria bacterium]